MAMFGKSSFVFVFLLCYLHQCLGQTILMDRFNRQINSQLDNASIFSNFSDCSSHDACVRSGHTHGNCCPTDEETYMGCCTHKEMAWYDLLVLVGIVTVAVVVVAACVRLKALPDISPVQPLQRTSSEERQELQQVLQKELKKDWETLPELPFVGFGIINSLDRCADNRFFAVIREYCRKTMKANVHIAFQEWFVNNRKYRDDYGNFLDYNNRERSYYFAIDWVRRGFATVWIAALIAPLLAWKTNKCQTKGLPILPNYVWPIMAGFIVAKLICEAGALVYTLPWQMFLTRDIGNGVPVGRKRFFGQVDFTHYHFYYWWALMYAASITSTVTLFKNLMFFSSISKLQECLDTKQTERGELFTSFWEIRVKSSVLGMLWNIMFSQSPSFLAEARFLFLLTFLQPILGFLLTIAADRPHDEPWLCGQNNGRQKEYRLCRKVTWGFDQYNSSVVGTLADLAQMVSITFWDRNIARRHPSLGHEDSEAVGETHENQTRETQKEWVIAENRAGRFFGERIRPRKAAQSGDVGRQGRGSGSGAPEAGDSSSADPGTDSGSLFKSPESSQDVARREEAAQSGDVGQQGRGSGSGTPEAVDSPSSVDQGTEISFHRVDQGTEEAPRDRGHIVVDQQCVAVKQIDFHSKEFAQHLVKRQLIRMINKLLLAGVFQSQFYCHLQLDFLSLSSVTWDTWQNQVFFGVLLNLLVSVFRCVTAFEFIKLYNATSKAEWDMRVLIVFFVVAIPFGLSFAYCIAKLIGIFACSSTFLTLRGCT